MWEHSPFFGQPRKALADQPFWSFPSHVRNYVFLAPWRSRGFKSRFLLEYYNSIFLTFSLVSLETVYWPCFEPIFSDEADETAVKRSVSRSSSLFLTLRFPWRVNYDEIVVINNYSQWRGWIITTNHDPKNHVNHESSSLINELSSSRTRSWWGGIRGVLGTTLDWTGGWTDQNLLRTRLDIRVSH